MRKKKSFNPNWIVAAVSIVALVAIVSLAIYGGQKGWFKGIFTAQITQEAFVPVNPPDISNNIQISLSITPDDICSGDTVTGAINSNMNNGICSIYFYITSWQLLRNVQLDSNGDFSASQAITSVGTATFKAVCMKENVYAVSNIIKLRVRACTDSDGDGIPDDTDADDDNDGYSDEDEIAAGTDPLNPNDHPNDSGVDCDDYCKGLDYTWGTGLVDSSSQCTSGIPVYLPPLNKFCCCHYEDEGQDESSDDNVVYCESAYPVPFSYKSCDGRTGCTRLENCVYVPAHLASQAKCECRLKSWECVYDWECDSGMECEDYQCVMPSCGVNLECYYIFGEGYVCRDGHCLQVTSLNCNAVAQYEGFDYGVWIPGVDYAQCYSYCQSHCGGICDTVGQRGTLGDCCGYSC